jgi:predicted nuclease with TOPRIM domain
MPCKLSNEPIAGVKKETKVKFQELQDAYLKLQTLSNDQKDAIQKLERQNATLWTEAEEFMLDLEQGNTKCQSLSKTVVLFSEQEEELRQRIHNLEEEVQKCMYCDSLRTRKTPKWLRLGPNDLQTRCIGGRERTTFRKILLSGTLFWGFEKLKDHLGASKHTGRAKRSHFRAWSVAII